MLHVTGFVLERLPYVFGEGKEGLLLQRLLQLLLFVCDKHRCGRSGRHTVAQTRSLA